jgi:kynureninase
MGSIANEQPDLLKMAKPTFPSEANTQEYAQSLDAKDHMRSFREKFIIPSKANLKAKKLAKPGKWRINPGFST